MWRSSDGAVSRSMVTGAKLSSASDVASRMSRSKPRWWHTRRSILVSSCFTSLTYAAAAALRASGIFKARERPC